MWRHRLEVDGHVCRLRLGLGELGQCGCLLLWECVSRLEGILRHGDLRFLDLNVHLDWRFMDEGLWIRRLRLLRWIREQRDEGVLQAPVLEPLLERGPDDYDLLGSCRVVLLLLILWSLLLLDCWQYRVVLTGELYI